MDKAKKKGITWGEAAKMVLECSSEPLNHKEILKAILDRNLKEVNLKFSQALACLNAMLHANSRTPSALFVKVSGKGTSYLLNKNRTDLVDSTDTDSDSPGSSSNDTDTKDTGEKMSTQFTGILSGNTSSGSLPPISSILGSYHSQGSSTSVTSSIECAIADSRLSSLIAPTPDPGRSALAKKRSIKPCFREGSSSKKPRVTFKLDNDKKVKSDRPARPPVKTKAELKYMGDDTAVSQNFIPPVLRPPMYPTHTVVKNSSSGYFGQKRHKKMSIAAQVKRSKEGQVDLVSPDSILSKINCKALMNLATFDLLPKHYQYQLVKLLPEVDREVGSKGEIKPTATAFSNEFITSAFESWKERLSEGEFTQEMSQKIQQEQEKVFNQDPWKTKHFESFWGEKFLENERYISPVERSHQIMEQVQVEWQKEQERLAKEKLENEKLEKEREKLKEAENTDLSAPNKLPKTDQDGAKNLTSKQKAALVRQQKLAKAKSVTNKAHKKTSEGKSSKSGKTSSKNGNEGAVKEKTKPKTKTKQTKVKPATNLENSDGLSLLNTVVDVVGVSVTEPDDVTSTTTTAVETAVDQQKASPTEAKPPLLTESTSILPSIPVVTEQPAIKEKPTKKPSKKKKETKSVNSALGFPCMCVLKPMVMCRRCGAFCHSDCINPMSICAACVA